ncbi:MAG: 4-oxalocrotonate tautomerase family protein [Alphaproteobacteria bacterium]|nr:4-oxalocrotonate tautomerase family protein [Alphaproteobacteria bacterium]
MPYVNIKVTREGGPAGTGPSVEQKKALIAGVTDLLVRVLDKDPATTFVVIDEVSLDNWGLRGIPTREYRAQQAR